MIKKILIGNTQVWLLFHGFLYYNENHELIESLNKYLCYFKFTEPTPMIYGELIKDEVGKPIVFQNIDDAITEVRKLIQNRFDL
jgi:hypothetical protein